MFSNILSSKGRPIVSVFQGKTGNWKVIGQTLCLSGSNGPISPPTPSYWHGGATLAAHDGLG